MRAAARPLIWLGVVSAAGYLGIRYDLFAPNLSTWLAAICTFAIYSILYRENVLFRFSEHIFIGLATGVGFYMVIVHVLHPQWWNPMVQEGRWWWVFTLFAGALFYTVYSRRLAWMNRLGVALFMGLSAGLGIVGFIRELTPQLEASFKPLWSAQAPYIEFNNVVFFVTLITVMSYFFFSFEQRHPVLQGSSRLGRWLLMVAFGAIFGNTVMGRMSLLIDRLEFLLRQWLQVFRG